jgi:hypothetical protein
VRDGGTGRARTASKSASQATPWHLATPHRDVLFSNKRV